MPQRGGRQSALCAIPFDRFDDDDDDGDGEMDPKGDCKNTQGASRRVLKSSKIEPRGASGGRVSACRFQGRSGGVRKIEFLNLLAPLGLFRIPFWSPLDLEWDLKLTSFR